MKIIRIQKEDWPGGIQTLTKTYQLFGPVKSGQYHLFQPIDEKVLPDFSFSNTRMSAKSLVQPQSEVMFEYTLDEKKEDHHILKVPQKNDQPSGIIGIRPCDAAAFLLVKRNFDTKDHRDPYWADAYEATALVGLACSSPCSSCFCTTAGCGPFHEDGLDVHLFESPKKFLSKFIREKGKAFIEEAA